MTRLLSWGECYNAAGQLWHRQRERRWEYVYGVPRGGCSAALLLQSLAHRDGQQMIVLDKPDSPSTTLIVDDIIDSGDTIRPYVDQGYHVDTLFRGKDAPRDLAIFATPVEGWVTFPFEVNEGSGAEDAIVRLLQFIGEDPKRDGLIDTPKRVLKAWKEMTEGYEKDPKEILEIQFDQTYDELVLLRGVEFYSTCEHHLLPFYGVASVGYIPAKGQGVVGLSKLARLVDCFARRLQIQERMTRQIAETLNHCLNPTGVGVVIRATHTCMSCRGIRKPDADMVTSVMMGALRDTAEARSEFLSLINLR